MTAALHMLPTGPTVEGAWERYLELVNRQTHDPALLTSIEHQIAVARAWRVWRDLFLEFDRVAT